MGVTIITKPKPAETPAAAPQATQQEAPAAAPVAAQSQPETPAAPVVPKGSQTILEAMERFVRQEQIGDLYLVHRTNGLSYQVMDFDLKSRYAKLKSPTGSRLNPRISERECAIYYPLWR